MPENNITAIKPTLEESIAALREEIANDATSRTDFLQGLRCKDHGVTKAVSTTKNVIGVVGLTALVTGGVAEAIAFTAAKATGLDYTFGSAVKALFKLGVPRDVT